MKKILPLLVILVTLSPSPLWANGEEVPPETPLGAIQLPDFLQWTKKHPGMSGIQLLINNAIRLIYLVAGISLFAMFIYGGFYYLTSGGDKARVETAKNIIAYALIGFTIIALSYAFIRIIGTFFGIKITGSP